MLSKVLFEEDLYPEKWDTFYFRQKMIEDWWESEEYKRITQEVFGKEICNKTGSSIRKVAYLSKQKQNQYVRECNPGNNTRAFQTSSELKPFVLPGKSNRGRDSKRHTSSRVPSPGKKKSDI